MQNLQSVPMCLHWQVLHIPVSVFISIITDNGAFVHILFTHAFVVEGKGKAGEKTSVNLLWLRYNFGYDMINL